MNWSSKTKFDFTLFFSVLFLLCFSLLAVYSATTSSDSPLMRGNIERQVIWILAGSLAALVMVYLPGKLFYAGAYPAYIILILLLILLLAGTAAPAIAQEAVVSQNPTILPLRDGFSKSFHIHLAEMPGGCHEEVFC